MKRPRRELTIFSLSALDVLAMSTGVFVLLLVMLMPSYQKVFDAQSEIELNRHAAAELNDRIARIDAEADRLTGEAEAARKQARALTDEAAAAERQTAEARARAQSIPRPVPRPVPQPAPKPDPVPAKGGDVAVVDALDLVFVIDTTASMETVLGELARSMRAIITILEQMVPSLQVGIVAYTDRDTGLQPLTVFPLTRTDRYLERVVAFTQRLRVSPIGSPTVEEDMYLGLEAAMAMPLRAGVRQALIIIGDAAAHPEEQQATLSLARSFHARGPGRTVSALFVTTPGSLRRGQIDRSFFQAVAQAGGGNFHDHSGSLVEGVLLSVIVD